MCTKKEAHGDGCNALVINLGDFFLPWLSDD